MRFVRHHEHYYPDIIKEMRDKDRGGTNSQIATPKLKSPHTVQTAANWWLSLSREVSRQYVRIKISLDWI